MMFFHEHYRDILLLFFPKRLIYYVTLSRFDARVTYTTAAYVHCDPSGKFLGNNG
jgi:hypothetical protein